MLNPYFPCVRWKFLPTGLFITKRLSSVTGICPFISFAILHKKKRPFFFGSLISTTKVLITLSFVCSEWLFEKHSSLSVQLPNHK